MTARPHRSCRAAHVAPFDLWTLTICTVRYSMGRMSTAPSAAATMVRAYSPHLADASLEQIAREVETELDTCEFAETTLGMDCDHKTWRDLATWIRRELAARTRR